MKYLYAIFVLCFVLGCGQPGPEGFPETIPFSVIVHLKNQPLENARIVLYSTGEQAYPWITSGETDSHGEAALCTVQGSHTVNGAVVGSYKVVVTKTEKIPETLSEEEKSKLEIEQLNAYLKQLNEKRAKARSLVPVDVTSPMTTNLRLEVKNGTAKETINIE